MIISDLNYLEITSEEVVGGQFFPFPPNRLDFDKKLNSTVNTNTNFTSNTNVNDVFNKTANINVRSNVTGNSSTFAFDNEAIGFNSNTQGALNQIAIAGQGSSQNGTFVAAANY